MKGTVKKVNEGIVFTIDERPKIGDWWYHSNGVISNLSNKLNDPDYEDCHKILASTFGIGLELWVNADNNRNLQPYSAGINIGDVKMSDKVNCGDEIFNTEHPYKIENNKVIIEL